MSDRRTHPVPLWRGLAAGLILPLFAFANVYHTLPKPESLAQIPGNRLHQHEPLRPHARDGVAHMQPVALPHQCAGDLRIQHRLVVGAGLLQIQDQDIDVAECELHGGGRERRRGRIF